MAFPISAVFQVISFLVQNKDQIKQVITDLETLMPSANGNAKLQVIKNVIATGLSIEAQIEAIWPLIAPMFSALVANIKGVTPPPVVPLVAASPLVRVSVAQAVK